MKKSILPLALGLLGLTISQSVLADVSGTVYRDLPVNGTTLNTYGVKDANESGVAGITVTVTGTTGNGSAVTAADGSWNVAGALGNVRVEFSDIPSYLESSPVNSDSNTTVQFISDSGVANLGLYDLNDYSDTATPIYITNLQQNGSGDGNTNPSIQSVNYTDTGLNSNFTEGNGTQGTGSVPTTDALVSQVGSTWGKALQKDRKRLFVSSALQRHIGFAPTKGAGDVYVIDYQTGNGSFTGSFRLQGVVADNGGTIDLGSVCRSASCASDAGNTGRDLDYIIGADIASPNIDLDAFSKVGKISYGDIDFDQSSNTLWLVNLHQKALISMDASGGFATLPGATNQYLIESLPNVPSCTGGDLRPWALTIHNGKGYLGAVCDALSSQNAADMQAYVLSFDINEPTTGFTTELSFPLNYNKDGDDWNPWSDTDQKVGSNWKMYIQPILSDIEFDEHNNMYLAFLDRYGLQAGFINYAPIAGITNLYADPNNMEKTISLGEILRVCNTNGLFELEGSGSCTDTNYGSEFFNDQSGDSTPDSSSGSLALLKGSKQILLGLIDPHPEGAIGMPYWSTQGTSTLSTINGSIENWYSNIYTGDTADGYNGKAHGMGDIELLTSPAPLEIGNRVWDDGNGNGVQDAGEAGIDGVIVTLNCGGADTTQTTANGGQYLFTNVPTDTDCTINVPTTVSGKALTTQNATVNEPLGSNPDNAGNFSFHTGRAGQNNHSYDIGYRSAPACIIDQPTVSTLCNDNGTPSDPSDDTFSYTINATGNNTGATYSISGDDTQNTLAYNTDHTFQSYPISGGNLSLTLTDVDTASCTKSPVIVTAPATCSSVLPKVDLELTKTANPMTTVSGDTVTYTLTVKNNGPDDATGVEVSDQLPSGVTYANNFTATQGNYDAGTGIWTVGDLANTATATLTIDVTID